MAKTRKKKTRKPNVKNILILVLLIVVLCMLIGFMKYKHDLKPVSNTSETVMFKVKDGQAGLDIANDLKEQGIVRNAKSTYYYAKLNHLTNIKAGVYEVNLSDDVDAILRELNDPNAGIQNVATVTIVEGDWAKHIALKIADQTNVSAESLMQLWNNKEWIQSQMGNYPFLTDEMFNENVRTYLEGYLAPNTYQFFKETTAEDVTKKILDQSLVVYNEFKDEMNKQDLSIEQLYTLASIVQFEASDEANMKEIAGVFYNRLKIDMPLQSSVTVCYAIDYEKTDNWMRCEVNSNVDSPYNTYKYKGLPPGPILNPGVMALDAVLHPNKSDYLYFMADVNGDGTVYYSKTLAEHEAYVRKYLQ